MDILRAVFGLVILISVAYIFSKDRKKIDWRLVGVGILIQVVFGLLIGQVAFVQSIFASLSAGFVRFLGLTLCLLNILFSSISGGKGMTSSEPVSLEIPRGLMRALGSRWRGQALFDNKSFCLFISPQIWTTLSQWVHLS